MKAIKKQKAKKKKKKKKKKKRDTLAVQKGRRRKYFFGEKKNNTCSSPAVDNRKTLAVIRQSWPERKIKTRGNDVETKKRERERRENERMERMITNNDNKRERERERERCSSFGPVWTCTEFRDCFFFLQFCCKRFVFYSIGLLSSFVSFDCTLQGFYWVLLGFIGF